MAAFAIQCARRVDPVFRLVDPERHAAWERDICRVLMWTRDELDDRQALEAADSAMSVVIDALRDLRIAHPTWVAAGAAVMAAGQAARAARNATRDPVDSAGYVREAASGAANGALEAASDGIDARSAIVADLFALRTLIEQAECGDPTIPPDVMGPHLGQ